MDMLPNSRHEAFAHNLARGMLPEAAYFAAGFKAHRGNAHRLSSNENVVARVADLKRRVQKMSEGATHRIVLSKEWVIEQLIDNVLIAKAQEKPDLAGANKALNLLGLELGMYVERKEVGKPGEFDGLTIADKRARIVGIAKQLGIERIVEAEQVTLDAELIEGAT